ncbi:hypothetical protein EC973_009345 [Apophysomyces ossiformis]|uniref:AB hydrolase-1 domain-containing protein n=1 Tax=Apophysomyces ossiformis TaxID=679940 RepID=A0A8H7BVF2_9FUNG|nr:hypothetical protein EC973_009345 [Apophysomyces ossiformis]
MELLSIIYCHWVRFPWSPQFTVPEYYGFAHNKVRSVRIKTADNVSIGAWHILPTEYHEQLHLREVGKVEDHVFDAALSDPNYDTVIYLHGNSMNRAAPWRVDLYKILGDKFHRLNVLTIDYRGFGDSEGVPSEQGLNLDAKATLDWLLQRNVSHTRISLIGHSLGTGVATSLAYEMTRAGLTPNALILKAAYSSLPNLIFEYRLLQYIPILGPLQAMPPVQNWILSKLMHTFDSLSRIEHVHCPVLILYGASDLEIPGHNSHQLFHRAAYGSESPVPFSPNWLESDDEIENSVIAGEATVYKRQGKSNVQLVRLNYADHNNVSSIVTATLSAKAQRRLSNQPFFQHLDFTSTDSDLSSTRKKTSHRKLSSARSSKVSSEASSIKTDDIPPPLPKIPRISTSARVSSESIENDARQSSRGTTQQQEQQQTNLVMLGGRQYFVMPGIYFCSPCDDDEADRLVILHFLLKYAFHGNFVAPFRNTLDPHLPTGMQRPQVLDIGCGPGTWILEMATEYPQTDFHGIDLRTMFPTTIKPSNAYFKQHNFFESLPYEDNTFDFVRIRLMFCNMTQAQWMQILKMATRVLKPEGYFEITDVENRIQRPGPLCETLLNQELAHAMRNYGIEFYMGHQISTLLMTQGFVNVRQQRVTMPLGWGGQMGEVHAQNFEGFFRSIHPSIKPTTTTSTKQVSQWQPAGMEHRKIVFSDAAIRLAMEECKKYQSHLNWFTCYGQKPSPADTPLSPRLDGPGSAVSLLATPMAHPTPSTPPNSLEEGTWETIKDFIDGYVD